MNPVKGSPHVEDFIVGATEHPEGHWRPNETQRVTAIIRDQQLLDPFIEDDDEGESVGQLGSIESHQGGNPPSENINPTENDCLHDQNQIRGSQEGYQNTIKAIASPNEEIYLDSRDANPNISHVNIIDSSKFRPSSHRAF
ncbi:hypothetical protein FGO68_gene87 [Halteria grandinella]|uniref:Uncharacterized protein n=1 Tax=Halteria grandinella TaxID=5974 RepID=A0A8J8NBR8_HALGN|nr:hypothetical protein FGO68_gene87 [Halteria grandinella]